MLRARIPVRVEPTVTLKAHQREAVAFVHRALRQPDGFVILADDMGMGKTLVALQVMVDALADPARRGAVLVLTTRVIVEEVWRPHLRRYAPAARVHVVGGDPAERALELGEAVAARHVVLCTTTMAGALHARDGAWAEATAGARLVVVDECQYMTNADSHLWQAVRARNDTPVLLMSGTPCHNQPARQLRALCQAAAAPGAALGAGDELSMDRFLALWAQRRDGLLLQRSRTELATRDPAMRRPALRQQLVACAFSSEQARLYHGAHAAMVARFQALQRARMGADPLRASACLRAYQAALTTLRAACTHPCIGSVARGDVSPSGVARAHARTKGGVSVKLHMALRFIRAQGVGKGRKVVVVSAFRCFLDILAAYLADPARRVAFACFTGAARGPARSAELARWKSPGSGTNVLLMTTQCGSAGISLDPDPHPDGRPRPTLVLDVDSRSELNPATRAQLLMRWNRRMNDPHQDTRVVSLVVPGTTDDIHEYLEAKRRGTDCVLGKRKAGTSREAQSHGAALARVLDRAWSRTAQGRALERPAR